MGAWGTGAFEDDDALDWVWELEEATDWSVVESALRGAAGVGPDDYLDAPKASIAWAAAVVVAAVDNPSIEVPDEVSTWLETHRADRPSTLRALAADALRRVLAENSEIVELWFEAEDEASWRASVDQTVAALG